MSSSSPIDVGRINNSYHKPILEDYDCPFLEDYHSKQEEQCDSEAEVKTMDGLVQKLISLPYWICSIITSLVHCYWDL